MAIDLSLLRKCQPDTSRRRVSLEGRMVILVKLEAGQALPGYTTLRGHIVENIFIAEIDAADLPRLDVDPAVESYSISQPLSKI